MGCPRAAERARATTLSYPRPACKEAVARAAVARDAHRAACARRRARTRHPECACHVVPRAPRLAVATKHVTPLGSTVNRCGYMRADQRHCDAVARRGWQPSTRARSRAELCPPRLASRLVTVQPRPGARCPAQGGCRSNSVQLNSQHPGLISSPAQLPAAELRACCRRRGCCGACW